MSFVVEKNPIRVISPSANCIGFQGGVFGFSHAFNAAGITGTANKSINIGIDFIMDIPLSRTKILTAPPFA